MSGKKKAQKMSLSDFLAEDGGTGSWADEMASLPSAPAARVEERRPSVGRTYGGRGDDLPRGPARDEGRFERRPPPPSRFTQRAPVDLPTQPPFTAHIANLSFDANEDDLADFFRGLKIVNIRILRDRDERSKGFGYVEFEDLESLKGALELSGETLHGRTIRVNVAEPPKERPERPPRQPDRTDVSSWRRETPLELPERRGGFRGGRNGGGFHDRRSDTSWSGGAFTRRGEGRFGRPEPPAERPKLNLKPRTVDSAKDTNVPRTTSSSNKPNPFGGAKPVDTESAIRRIEEKLSKASLESKKEEQH